MKDMEKDCQHECEHAWNKLLSVPVCSRVPSHMVSAGHLRHDLDMWVSRSYC